MNDSPVDCQNRDRLFRRKANPSLSTNKKDSVRSLFCFVKNGFEGAGMNDSPVDCQNRERLFRRKANPSLSTASEQS